MKNDKMIVLIQVLERGNNYVVVTIKGTELQETTVCHAEESENINDIGKEWFEGTGLKHPHFGFSLSPLKQINFPLYDDQKTSLVGFIDNPEFHKMMK
jgi:hypothetical protein